MDRYGPKLQRLHAALHGLVSEQQLGEALHNAGLELLDRTHDEMPCRWVPVREREVPPQADTIIRTITITNPAGSFSSTFWLDGLRGPVLAPLRG